VIIAIAERLAFTVVMANLQNVQYRKEWMLL